MTNSFYQWTIVYDDNHDVMCELDYNIIYEEKYNLYDIGPDNQIINDYERMISFKSNNLCAIDAHELMELIKSVFIMNRIGYSISAIKYYEAESESIFSESSPCSGDKYEQ